MKFDRKNTSMMLLMSFISALTHGAYDYSDIVVSTDMSDVDFALTGRNVSLDGNTFLFPEEDHYCAKKIILVDYKAGDKITLELDADEAKNNDLSLNLMTWGDGGYKSFGGAAGVGELTSELAFNTHTISVGFCRYNNKVFEEFDVSEFTARRQVEVEDEVEDTVSTDPSVEIIISTTDLESAGFLLTGDGVSLSGNEFTFPEDGHYCATKTYDVDYKAGEQIVTSLDPLDAINNGLQLNVKAWGDGQYKGYSGATGAAELTAELTFDADTISVGFCRYNNKSFDAFRVSRFEAIHKIQEFVETVTDTFDGEVPVYPSCKEYADESGENVLIVDDSEPRTLQELFDDGTIQPGMLVKLRRADGAISLSSGNHAQFMDSDSPWVTIMGEDGASIDAVSLSSVKNIRFTGLNIGSEQSGFLINTYGTENIIVDNNYVSAGDDYESWDVQTWLDIGSGMMFNRSKCSTAYNNELKNLRHGIHTYAYDEEMRDEYQSMKALLKDNFIQNISGDFFQAIGSDITVDSNTGLDQWVSGDDGDSNHDDFVQGFAYPLGTSFDNVKIINNFYQATTDLSRPLQSPGQGIVIFDGLYSDFEISNNTLISDMYHGISVYWGKDGLIKNNTSIVLDDTSDKKMWIYTTADKSGKNPPENVKVINNVTSQLSLHANSESISQNNVVIPLSEIAAELVEYDPVTMTYDISVKQDSYYYVEGTGSDVTTVEESMK